MLLSLLLAAVRSYRVSLLVTAATILAWSALAATPVWLPMLLWCAAGLPVLAVWLLVEPSLHRFWGARRPSTREGARLATAVGLAAGAQAPVFLMREDAAIDAMAGIRTIVVSTGTLEALDDRQLAGVLVHELAHVRSLDPLGRALVWLGVLPILALAAGTGLVARLGRLLASLVGAALIVPALLWPVGFATWVGRLITVPLVFLIGLYCLAQGAATHAGAPVAIGIGTLLAWALAPGLRALVAWEDRRREAAADRATIAAGLGDPLLEALTLIQSLEQPGPSGPVATLLSSHPRAELRIDLLQRLLAASHL